MRVSTRPLDRRCPRRPPRTRRGVSYGVGGPSPGHWFFSVPSVPPYVVTIGRSQTQEKTSRSDSSPHNARRERRFFGEVRSRVGRGGDARKIRGIGAIQGTDRSLGVVCEKGGRVHRPGPSE